MPARAAARPLIAVVPFSGPQAKAAEAEVVRALRTRARLVPASRWKASSRKLFAPSHSAEDISAVAEDVGAVLVITGAVKRDGRRWQLAVTVHDGQTGRGRDRLKYPLKGPRVERRTLNLLGVEVQAAFVHALSAAGPTASAPEETPQPKAQPKVATIEDDSGDDQPAKTEDKPEAPPLGAAPAEKPAENSSASVPLERPEWAPYFEVSAGGLISARSWDFQPTTLPRFHTPGVVPGVQVDLTLYPLAFLWDRTAGVFSTLGLGATLDKPIWGPATGPDPSDATKYGTSELRVEGGLRWRFVLYKPLPRPELVVEAGGGLHQFAIAKRVDPVTMNPVDVGPPDVGYAYVSLGGKLRLHFARWALIWAGFHYDLVTTAGPATTSDEYGPARTYGLRVEGGLTFRVWRGLEILASGFYERFQLTFRGSDPPPALPGMGNLAESALDQYFGGALSVGYEY